VVCEKAWQELQHMIEARQDNSSYVSNIGWLTSGAWLWWEEFA
jgi:hypothetical protein